MEFLTDKVLVILPWAQIILSIILGASILLQQTGAGVGGAFGGGDESIRYTRRGMEKVLFYVSIIVATLFALSAFVLILIQR
jgi:preprotein translocase subunit SecG